MAHRHFAIAKQLFPSAIIANFTANKEETGFPLTFNTREEIVNFSPQISVIATTANLHLEYAIFLAGLNSHLLIEKPISVNLAGIESLVKIQRQKNLSIVVGYNLEYLPSLRIFESALSNGIVGRVLNVQIEVGQDLLAWRPNRDYKSSASAKRELGGGVLRELSHEIHYFLGIFGYPKWVFATLNHVGDLELDVEDTAHLIFGMQDKNRNEFNATLHLDFVRKNMTRTCKVIGTQGTINWNLLNGEIHKLSENSGSCESLSKGTDLNVDTYISEWEDLLNCITRNSTTRNCIGRAAQTLKLVLACEESNERESKVYLPTSEGALNWRI